MIEIKNEEKIKKGKKESLYDKIPFTVRQLDIIIWVMIVLFVVVFTLGIMEGNK